MEKIDSLLADALDSVKYKSFVVSIENNILDLLKSQEVQLEYFQLNSYYRLLIHKIGDYYGLARQIDNVRKCIILYKTSATKEPINKLKDMTRKVSIMQRKVDTQPQKQSIAVQIHPLEDREAIYEATRARIFSDDSKKCIEIVQNAENSMDRAESSQNPSSLNDSREPETEKMVFIPRSQSHLHHILPNHLEYFNQENVHHSPVQYRFHHGQNYQNSLFCQNYGGYYPFPLYYQENAIEIPNYNLNPGNFQN